jgi:RNA ligase
MKTKTLHIDSIETLIEQGYIVKNKHPQADLWIYNYTQFAQFDQYWTEETIICRGLILDSQGMIKARPLPKFFNIEELAADTLPKLPFDVYEKVDGSLGILYWLDGKPQIATRGSFTSKQAVFATELLYAEYAHTIANLEASKTYIFEIIYPENRIVVDYQQEQKLVLLAIIDIATGKEETLINLGFELPKHYDLDADFQNLKKLDWDNHEGFVIKYTNGYRVKIKFENYMATHKIVTQLSSITIWELLKENKPLVPFLEDVPDEFYNWVRKTEQKLRADFKAIEDEAKAAYKELDTAKETAFYFQTCAHTAILFAMYTNKNYQSIIWKRIRPQFEKAFSH